MKKRLLSLVLAASMILGSVNVVFADETSVPVDSEVVAEAEADDAMVIDDVESEAAVDVDLKAAKADGTFGPYDGPDGEKMYWETTSPWKATVYGDAGGQTKIDNLGNPDWAEYKKDADGNTIYTYDVVEDGRNVNVRMGIPSDDMKKGLDSQGKIASSSDGRVMYYQELTADDDFTLTATAHINGIANNNSQVSFGAAVIDDITPFVHTGTDIDPANSVNAGVRQMDKAQSDITAMEYAFVRNNGELKGYKVESKNSSGKDTTVTLPAAGQDVKIQLKKSGDTYTMVYGDQKTTFDAAEEGLTMTDDIYVGFYATRCADITFKNVSLAVVGRKVELPEWKVESNGLNGDSDQTKYTKFKELADGFKLTIDDKDVGKFTDGEDSYSYYSVQAPAGEDFKLNATINSMSINVAKSPKQAAVGVMISDEHYTKNGELAKDDCYANSLSVLIVVSVLMVLILLLKLII